MRCRIDVIQRVGSVARRDLARCLYVADVRCAVRLLDGDIHDWVFLLAPVCWRGDKPSPEALTGRTLPDAFRAVTARIVELVDEHHPIAVAVVWRHVGDADRWRCLYRAHHLERFEPDGIQHRDLDI